MTSEDFLTLKHFVESEVTDTGASLDSVQLVLMQSLDAFRSGIGRRVHLLSGGMTTGTHSAPEHPQGLAADVHLDDRDGHVDHNVLYEVFRHAISAGFTGIGMYFNGHHWSFHLDLRSLNKRPPSFWTGRPSHSVTSGRWKYDRMLIGMPQGLLQRMGGV